MPVKSNIPAKKDDSKNLDMFENILPKEAVPYSVWKKIKEELGTNYYQPVVQELMVSHAQQLGSKAFWEN